MSKPGADPCMGLSESSGELSSPPLSFVPSLCSAGRSSLRPNPRFAYVGARGSCQGWPSHQPCGIAPPLPGHTWTASSTTARLARSGDDQRGARTRSIAPQPCIRWEQEPDHDAAMRIGSEAPRRRTHSSSRHDSHESPRDPATSNRHRRPRHKWMECAETVGCLQYPPFMMQDAERRRPAQRPLARTATRRSEACAPRPRSWACECRGRSWYGFETTAPRHCSPGT
jgi:hypothetical protein